MLQPSFKGQEELSDLRQTLILAGKTLNTWFAFVLPLYAKHSFKKALTHYDAFSKKLNTLDDELTSLIMEHDPVCKSYATFQQTLQKIVGTLSEAAARETNTQVEFLPEDFKSLSVQTDQTAAAENKLSEKEYIAKRQSIMKRKVALGIEYGVDLMKQDFGYAVYFYPFNKLDSALTFVPDDFNALQKEVIKKLKFFIMQEDSIDTLDVEAFFLLFRNLSQIIQLGFFDKSIVLNFKWIEAWVKLGFALIERADALAAKDPIDLTKEQQFFIRSIKNTVSSHILVCYVGLARMQSLSANSDIDLLFAESCAESAQQLNTDYVSRFKVTNTFGSLIDATFARIAYKRKNDELFQIYLQKLPSDAHFSSPVIEVLALAGDYFKMHYPLKALHYYELALLKLNNAPKDHPLLSQETVHQNKLRITEHCNVIKREQCKLLRAEIRRCFSEAKIKKSEKEGELHIFIPLELISPQAHKLLNSSLKSLMDVTILDGKTQGNNVFTGLQIITRSQDVMQVLKELEGLVKRFQNAIDRCKQQHVFVPAAATTSVLQPSAVPQDEPKEKHVGGLKEQIAEPYQRPIESKKEKTRKAPPPTTGAPEDPVPPPIDDACHANDFGFNVQGNPLVTPVYCSKGSQAQRRTSLFVRWVGIPKMDKISEGQFESMLNPNPDGILTVGPRNQQGAKLWKNPDALGESWNMCALRFKRKGASGSFRAIAEPESKITLTKEDGEQENRYLFKLGSYVQK